MIVARNYVLTVANGEIVVQCAMNARQGLMQKKGWIEMRVFDIMYHSTRMGDPAVKEHRLFAANEAAAIRALKLWKGAKKEDIIEILDVGEVVVSSGFKVKI